MTLQDMINDLLSDAEIMGCKPEHIDIDSDRFHARLQQTLRGGTNAAVITGRFRVLV